MSTHTNNSIDDTIDLRELFFALLARWKLIALCIILSVICAVLYLRVTPNTYAVDALVRVEDKKSSSAALLGQELSGLISSAGIGGQSVAQAEIEILKSRLILGTTIKNLNLDLHIQPADYSFWQKLTAPIQFKTQYSPKEVIVTANDNQFIVKDFVIPSVFLDHNLRLNFTQEDFTLTDEETDFVVFKGKLNQNNILETSDGLWKVTLMSQARFEQPFFISKRSLPTAMGAILDNYSAAEKGKLTGVIGLGYQGTDQAQITNVLNVILNTYQKQNIEQNSEEKEQTLKFLNKQLPELKTELDQVERQFNTFRERNNTVDVSKESELYLTQSIELETQKIQLEQKQAELAARYTSKHPMMLEINAQLGSITKKINELNKTLKRIPDVQRQFLQYYRDVEVKTQLYTNLLNTYQTLNVAKAGEVGNIRIIDYAIEPIKPIKPRKPVILVLSIFVGGFIGTLIALLINMMRSGIRDSSQIETTLGIPVYGTIPSSVYQPTNIKKRAHIPVLAITHGDDIAVESLRSVRTALLFALAQAKNNILFITSSAPEAGKSFVAANMAVLLAQNEKRVLLIDADLRRGYLHKYFRNQNKLGLSDILSGQAEFSQVVQSTVQDCLSLNFLPRGQHPSHPSELLNSEKFVELLTQLQSQYDYIVMDSAPILAVTDGLILAKHTGVNLVIAHYAKTQLHELELVMSRFDNIGVKLNGVILNNIPIQTRNYKYGYQYVYQYQSDKKNLK